METLKNIYDIEIIGSEKIISHDLSKQNNNDPKAKHLSLQIEQDGKSNPAQKRMQGEDDDDDGSDDDFLVIELVDEKEEEEGPTPANEAMDAFVDIELESSKQLLVYLVKKPRMYIRYRSNAVTHVAVMQHCISRKCLVFLKPCYRISIKNTENWYYNYCHTIYLRPATRRSVNRRPVHYTEKVESRDAILDDVSEKNKDISGYQIKFVNEANNEISKLTLSADFTLSYEEKANVKEIETDIDITGDQEVQPGLLRRSYSIEFLNENNEQSMSSEQIASRIEQGDGQQIYDDYDDESEYSVNSSQDNRSSALKRSYSIEFLNEKEDETQPFSSEIVSYKIDKGEGVLVYSDVQHASTTVEDDDDNDEDERTNLKRSYSIEFLDDSQDKRSAFSYETISNKIEKGEGRLVYVDTEVSDPRPTRKKKARTPSQKLKTLNVSMHADDGDDRDEGLPLSKQNKAYSIEFLNERDNHVVPVYDDYIEDDVISSEVFVDQQEQPPDYLESEVSLELRPQMIDIDIDGEDASLHEKRAYSIEFLDEEDDMAPIFEDNQTSTPSKTRPRSPKKSPLQTISIDWEFEKRNRLEQDDLNDTDDYLLYEEDVIGGGKNQLTNGNGDLSRGKLETIEIDMETHHKMKIPVEERKRDFQLEFQSEQERRRSMMKLNELRKARLSSESSGHLRTVSVETDAEEIIEEVEPLQQSPTLMKRKCYSVELLNEFDGDKSAFAEEIDDDGKWIINI